MNSQGKSLVITGILPGNVTEVVCHNLNCAITVVSAPWCQLAVRTQKRNKVLHFRKNTAEHFSLNSYKQGEKKKEELFVLHDKRTNMHDGESKEKNTEYKSPGENSTLFHR